MTQGYTNYIFAFYNCLLTLEQTRKHGNTIKRRRRFRYFAELFLSDKEWLARNWPVIAPKPVKIASNIESVT